MLYNEHEFLLFHTSERYTLYFVREGLHRLVLVHLHVCWREIVTKTESERDAQRQLINCPPRPQGNLSEEKCPLTVPLISMEAGCHLTQHGETSRTEAQGHRTRSHVSVTQPNCRGDVSLFLLVISLFGLKHFEDFLLKISSNRFWNLRQYIKLWSRATVAWCHLLEVKTASRAVPVLRLQTLAKLRPGWIFPPEPFIRGRLMSWYDC